MNELLKLRDMLCKELEEYGEKGELSGGTLDVVDKLAHALKNLDKIIAYKDEGEYSGRGWPDGGYRYGSYARGRDGMGRYSRHSGLADELRGLMDSAPNETIRRDLQRLVEKVEQ